MRQVPQLNMQLMNVSANMGEMYPWKNCVPCVQSMLYSKTCCTTQEGLLIKLS
jgi:hypothetical protein